MERAPEVEERNVAKSAKTGVVVKDVAGVGGLVGYEVGVSFAERTVTVTFAAGVDVAVPVVVVAVDAGVVDGTCTTGNVRAEEGT